MRDKGLFRRSKILSILLVLILIITLFPTNHEVWAETDEGVVIGIPIWVACEKESDLPPAGTKFVFELEALEETVGESSVDKGDIPMPVDYKAIELEGPSKAGEENAVGYESEDDENPWKITFNKNVRAKYI